MGTSCAGTGGTGGTGGIGGTGGTGGGDWLGAASSFLNEESLEVLKRQTNRLLNKELNMIYFANTTRKINYHHKFTIRLSKFFVQFPLI